MWKTRSPYTLVQKKRKKCDPIKANPVQANDNEIVAIVLSHVNMVANMKAWWWTYGPPDIFVQIKCISSYINVRDREEKLYIGDSSS